MGCGPDVLGAIVDFVEPVLVSLVPAAQSPRRIDDQQVTDPRRAAEGIETILVRARRDPERRRRVDRDVGPDVDIQQADATEMEVPEGVGQLLHPAAALPARCVARLVLDRDDPDAATQRDPPDDPAAGADELHHRKYPLHRRRLRHPPQARPDQGQHRDAEEKRPEEREPERPSPGARDVTEDAGQARAPGAPGPPARKPGGRIFSRTPAKRYWRRFCRAFRRTSTTMTARAATGKSGSCIRRQT